LINLYYIRKDAEFSSAEFGRKILTGAGNRVSDYIITSNTMATVVAGTGQLLDLLAKAGGSPAALIYKAGTDLYDYYRSSDAYSPAKITLQTAEEIYWKWPMLFLQ
jgi:hypothetical protein